MAFDLVFSPNEHAFTVVDHFDHWMIVLDQLKALQDDDTITIGHDTPVHRSAIDSTISYVKCAREIHAASADAKIYSESLKPSRTDMFVVRRPSLAMRTRSLRRAEICGSVA
jgi:hypothetical protein